MSSSNREEESVAPTMNNSIENSKFLQFRLLYRCLYLEKKNRLKKREVCTELQRLVFFEQLKTTRIQQRYYLNKLQRPDRCKQFNKNCIDEPEEELYLAV